MEIFFQNIIPGIIVLILGQCLLMFVIQPLKDFKKSIGKIDNKLKYYANVIVSGNNLPDEMKLEAAKSIRDLSCELEASYKIIPFKQFLEYRAIIQTKKEIADSARSLIFLSNNTAREGQWNKNADEIAKIRKNLNIPEL
jgi:hypothetical protein